MFTSFLLLHVYSYKNITAQPSAILTPKIQNVCAGEIVSYNCIANGSIMDVYCPPLVDVSRPLTLLARDPVGTFRMESNSTSTIHVVLVQSTGESSFMGTISFYFSDEQMVGTVNVQCRVSTADGVDDTDSATFFMSGEVHCMQ